MVDSDHEIDAGVLVFQRLSQAAPQGTPLVDLVLWTICEVTLRHEHHKDRELNFTCIRLLYRTDTDDLTGGV